MDWTHIILLAIGVFQIGASVAITRALVIIAASAAQPAGGGFAAQAGVNRTKVPASSVDLFLNQGRKCLHVHHSRAGLAHECGGNETCAQDTAMVQLLGKSDTIGRCWPRASLFLTHI